MSSSLSHDSATASATTSTEDIVPPSPADAAKTSTTTGILEAVLQRDELVMEEGSLAREVVSMVQPDDSTPLQSQSELATKPTTVKKKNSKMEALEIEIIEENNTTADDSADDMIIIESNSPQSTIRMNKSQDEFDDDLDRANADMEGLLSSSSNSNGNNNRTKNNKSSTKRLYQTKRVTRRPKTSSSSSSTLPSCVAKCCGINNLERHGNCVVFCPRVYAKTGWGIMGPHWFGPPCCAAVILFASLYFIRHGLVRIGPITAGISVMFTILNIYLLINTCYRNPGIVMPAASDDDGAPSPQHRWCDFCKAYQPPSGAHCPDCNCCIQGYDHHCVWMGTCIGKKNYKQFVRFNLSWLVHLLYAVLWVSVVGPILYRNKDKEK